VKPRRALALLTISLALLLPGPGRWALGASDARRTAHVAPRKDLRADLDEIFADPVLVRALMGIRVESLRDGKVIYQRNSEKLVMPASNMKLFTLAAAVDRLGWDYRWETRLETAGKVENGALRGDLWVIGSGDPTIGAKDNGFAPLFLEWADALAKAGIRRIDGRIIGDDDAFDDTGVGPGWAWDYLDADYAAPSGRCRSTRTSSRSSSRRARTRTTRCGSPPYPAGHGFEIANGMISGEPGSAPSISISRRAGSMHLDVSGSIPANGPVVTRTTTVENPTKVFVEAFKLALASRGIAVRDGADDGDDVMRVMMVEDRRVLAKHSSAPLAEIAGGFSNPARTSTAR
jgi:D-alanyl-D-alanine carboxypeptidase/D-alanyl-D-alanine-endopeptidase (penicillin-binding protein 4)